MCGQNGQVIVSRRDHTLAADEISDWNICCVAAVAMSHNVSRSRLSNSRCLQEVVKSYASPHRIKL